MDTCRGRHVLVFVKDCVAKYNLHVVAMRFFPFEAIEILPSNLDAVFSKSSPFEELALTIHKPSLPVKSQLNFYDQNPGVLRLDIKRPTEKGLEETWLAARTDNEAALSVWRKVAKRLKQLTKQGATVTNPKTGDRGPARSHRFTAGALKLYKTSIPLLTITGFVLSPTFNSGKL